MKKIFLLLLAMGALALMAQSVLPTCYYTYDEVVSMLNSYEDQYPAIAKVHLIGYSQQDEVPIYALQISDNVNVEEDEPAILFLGQVHAEEVMGVQIVMDNIQEILSQHMLSPHSQWVNNLDMWFIPTLNPEGHNVVTSNMDTSWRKNKRDNNNNGILDLNPLVGYDIDGVDINRNFSFNWAHGDTLLQPGSLEVYDYYRGPAPMSESEVIALKDLCDQHQFVWSIVWHSSRTGNLSEKLYYPFNWKNVRPSPDINLFASIGQGVAAQIINEAGTASYEYLPNLSRKGATHDWMYQQYGTVQMLIECATRNLQPDSLLMVDTVNRCSNGVRWLLNRALPFSTATASNSMLTGTVKDPDGNPLVAQIVIAQHNAPWFRPRLSEPTFGRYWRPLLTGSYTLMVQKEGYQPYEATVTVNNSAWTTHNVVLQPLATAAFAGRVVSGGETIPAMVVLRDLEKHSINTDGEFLHHHYSGTYRVEVSADDHFPWVGEITLNPGYNYYVFNLENSQPILAEDWENGTDNWILDGPWVVQSDLAVSGNAITDSYSGKGLYEQNCDVSIKYHEGLYIPGGPDVMLSFDSHLQTEQDYDPCTVEISTDNGETWVPIWLMSGLRDSFERYYLPMGEFAGQQVQIRFRLVDQSTNVELTDLGWTIDNILLESGASSAVANEDETALPLPSLLYANYPNPFNPSTTIRYSLATTQAVKLQIYNQRGQLVKTLVDDVLAPGDHQITWDGTDSAGRSVSSGIYFYRLHSPQYSQTRKMVMIK